MKKLFTILILVALLMTGCGNTVYKANKTVYFPDDRKPGEPHFPTHYDNLAGRELLGEYTGKVNDQGLPDGHGTFVYKHPLKYDYVIEGEFKNGHYVR